LIVAAGRGKEMMQDVTLEKLPAPLPPSSHGKAVDVFPEARALEGELRKTVRGEVRFDAGSRALYATDASNYRQVPIGLVIPRDAEDVIAAVAAARKFGAPILARGGGTSLAGQCCNVAVVLDFSKYMNKIVELNPAERYAVVEPGVVLDNLRDAAEKYQLTFAPDPATHNRCTLGGMIGNNACGTHSIMGGKTADNIIELDILLYDGTRMTVGAASALELEAILKEGGRRAEIYRGLAAIRDATAAHVRKQFPQIPRRVSGYNLDELLPEKNFNVARALVGTEGTCVIVLAARVKLIDSPQHRRLVGLGYEDIYLAADDAPRILEFGPIALEGMQGETIDILREKKFPGVDLIPQGGGLLLAEFGADDPEEAKHKALRLMEGLKRPTGTPAMRLYTNAEARQVWHVRESGPRASNHTHDAPLLWEGWEDAAVAPEKLGNYLRDLRKLLDEFRYQARYYGHFGHGCIHMQIDFDLLSEPGIRKFMQFLDRATDLVVSYGGSISGEHGDGQARASLLPRMFGPELMEAFRQFKRLWDPSGKMNPGKLVDPYSPSENLRLGADYHPLPVLTHFKYAEDEGDFPRAMLRCAGIGACRKTDSGTMCPSYRATMEERHSTRGRARMLFEMLQQEITTGGWNSHDVKESLDLCLSCKACKTECPVNVDMATYKAEFLSHYYERHRRPLNAYAFGYINKWARLGSILPGISNALIDAPGLKQVFRRLLGISAARQFPRLAPRTFRRWARRNCIPRTGKSAETSSRQKVILWTDTFTNYFHPQAGEAVVEVLRHAGFEPWILSKQLCCGRPLYDFGLLDDAKLYLRRILKAMQAEIRAGTPVLVLEPSCCSVFRDELCNLFPHDPLADRLRRQTFLLGEFLARYAPGYVPPKLERKAMLHNHCHQKAIMKSGDAGPLLRTMGIDLSVPDSGCCGMAGPFGFEAEKYEVSQAIGERVLLPAVRAAAVDALIVTDGFSCREQIEQGTGRRAFHLAEVLRMAIEHE
jgi:FAD/FMN-containing dehydrogenase/Fe-S oxidoreductase